MSPHKRANEMSQNKISNATLPVKLAIMACLLDACISAVGVRSFKFQILYDV